jgi:transposase-like protein
MLKIATWNLDRPRKSSRIKSQKILEQLREVNADILVLTETNSSINPGEEYQSFATKPLVQVSQRDGVQYAEGENRVTIWSKYSGIELSRLATHSPPSASRLLHLAAT